MSSNLWKPISERDGNLVILFDHDPGEVVLRDSSGNIIARGRNTGPSNDRAATVRFPAPGYAYQNVVMETGSGESVTISDGGMRYSGFNLTPAGQVGPPLSGGQAVAGAMGGFGGMGWGIPGVALPFMLDPNFITENPIEASPIDFEGIDQADFDFTDPLAYAKQIDAYNRKEQRQAFNTGIGQALQMQKRELQSIQYFAKQMSQTQKQLVADENIFNQQQLIQAADTAIPGIQDMFADQRDRAETLASGRLVSDAEDRAFELAARSASADGSFVRGFGDDSVVGRRQSDILSAQQRLGLMQIGENLLTSSIANAAGILMDSPLKTNISQGLPSQPNVPLSTLAAAQGAQIAGLTTVDPSTATNQQIQQQQFATNLEQTTNQFNASNQLAADQFNSSQDVQVQTFNSNQRFQVQLQQLGIMASNAMNAQAGQQAIYDAAAANEQTQTETQIRDENSARLDRLIKDFQNNRDKNQLIEGAAKIFGVAVSHPKIKEFVDGVIDKGLEYVSEGYDYIADLLFGDSSVTSASNRSLTTQPATQTSGLRVGQPYSSTGTTFNSRASLVIDESSLNEFRGII